jgi:hypothetical protein
VVIAIQDLGEAGDGASGVLLGESCEEVRTGGGAIEHDRDGCADWSARAIAKVGDSAAKGQC